MQKKSLLHIWPDIQLFLISGLRQSCPTSGRIPDPKKNRIIWPPPPPRAWGDFKNKYHCLWFSFYVHFLCKPMIGSGSYKINQIDTGTDTDLQYFTTLTDRFPNNGATYSYLYFLGTKRYNSDPEPILSGLVVENRWADSFNTLNGSSKFIIIFFFPWKNLWAYDKNTNIAHARVLTDFVRLNFIPANSFLNIRQRD